MKIKESLRHILSIAWLETRRKKRTMRPKVVVSLLVVLVLFVLGFWFLFYYGNPLNSVTLFEIRADDPPLQVYLNDSFRVDRFADVELRKTGSDYVYLAPYGMRELATRSAILSAITTKNTEALTYYGVEPLHLVYVNMTSVFREEILDWESQSEFFEGRLNSTSVSISEDNLEVRDPLMEENLNGGLGDSSKAEHGIVESQVAIDGDDDVGSDTSANIGFENIDSENIHFENNFENRHIEDSSHLSHSLSDFVVNQRDGVLGEEDVFIDQNGEIVEGFVNTSDLLTPEDMRSFSFVGDLLLFVQIIFVLNIVGSLFGTSMFEEKINQRCSLLFSFGVKHYEVIIGKALPYFAFGFLFSLVVLFFKSAQLLLNPLVYVIIVILLLLYLGISCLNAFVSRSSKEFSFINVFFVAAISLYLLIPAFMANISELSYASILTPLLLYSQNAVVDYSILLFVIPLYLLFALLLFLVASFAWDPETYFDFSTPLQKLQIIFSRALVKPWHFFVYGMGSVALGWLIQLSFVVALLAVTFEGKLLIFFVLAGFVEELLRNFGCFSVMNKSPSFFRGHKRKVLFSVMTGLGFMFAEKGLLALSIAPFLQGYQLLVLTGLIVPFLLHTFFTLLFVYGASYFPVLRKHYFWSMVFLGLVHSAFNYSIILLMGVAS